VERENGADGFLSNVGKVLFSMSQESDSSSTRSRFSLRHIGLVSLAFLVLMVGASGNVASSTGIDLNGKDIVDSGTVIWDGSTGEIPNEVIGINLSTNAGNDLTWDSNNEEFDVESSNIQSGTTASDVGLGNVENTAAVNESGDTMTGDLTFSFADLNMGGNFISSVGKMEADATEYGSSVISIETGDGDGVGENAVRFTTGGGTLAGFVSLNNSGNDLILSGDSNEADDNCVIDSDANIDCAGSKNWVHELNSTHKAVYTSQESPEVRAVFEGKAHVVDSKKIELPSHFSKTVSDSEPMLRAQVTPQGTFTKSVVMDKTDHYIEIKVGKETDVNFRITGIREGYEDKQVVRQKE